MNYKKQLTVNEPLECTHDQKLALFHYWSTVIDKDNLSKYNVYLLEDSLNTTRDFKNDKWRTLSIQFDELPEEDACSVLDSIEDSFFLDNRLSFEEVSTLSLSQQVALFNYWSKERFDKSDNFVSEHNYFVLRYMLDNS